MRLTVTFRIFLIFFFGFVGILFFDGESLTLVAKFFSGVFAHFLVVFAHFLLADLT